MLENTHFDNLENKQIKPTAKFFKFSLILIFGAFILLNTAETARAAGFIVDRTDDADVSACTSASGDCTLRGAISAANAAVSGDVITFDQTVFNSPLTITLTGGELRIANNGSLTIFGSGVDKLTISGNNQSRVFRIDASAEVIIRDLMIADGSATAPNNGIGGGILNGGNLSLNNTLVTNNKANSAGGGIYNLSGITLGIFNSTIERNSTLMSGATGGGIYTEGDLNIFSTTVVNNTSALGGGLYRMSGLTNIGGSNFRNNSATDSGGGIFSLAGSIFIDNTFVITNSAVNEGGGIRNSGTLTITGAEINNNTAAVGGGIYDNGAMEITRTGIDGNQAGFGGGISKIGTQGALITRTTISNNTATDGAGGIFNRTGNMQLVNSTITGNSATQDGGGINNLATLDLIYVTVANNTAASGGGIINRSGTVNASNTIIGDNSSEDFFGTLNSQGNNLVENTTNTSLTATVPGIVITGRDPQLLPLRPYGGNTKTLALRITSPAIDAGRAVSGLTINTDQRGLPRPFDFPNIPNAADGNGSDLGAFERQPEDVRFTTTFDFDGDGRADISVFRPSQGNWYIRQSTAGFTGVTWGVGTDTLVPDDYDGDGRTDYAVFRKSDNSTWYILRSSDNAFQAVQFGAPNVGQAILFDTPIPADYDGDGKTDIAIYRLTDNLSEPGRFNILRSSDNTISSVQFGTFGDKPVPADYDGDGRADIAVNRGGIWYILRSSDSQFFVIQFGTAQDKLVPADYDGDGKTDIAVYRESNGTWYYLQSGNENNFVGVRFGASEDKPVPADYDGDGRADIAVFRPSNGAWYRLNSTDNSFFGLLFGFGTDKPIPNVFVR